MIKKVGGRAKKSRQQLNEEGRLRKKQKKHQGNPAGSRIGSVSAHSAKANKTVVDPRIGSKTPVPLVADHAGLSQPVEPLKEALSLEQQLQQLEADPRLTLLLDKLDEQQILTTTEQRYVEQQLDKIEKLMEQLGLVIEDEPEQEQPAKKEDLFRFLQNDPQRRQ